MSIVTIYRWRPLCLSRSAVRYTRSPFETRELQSGVFLLDVFEDSLRGWLRDLEVYCSSMMVRSFKGICSFVNMSLWVQISQADMPRPRIRLFKCAVAIQRVRPVIVPPDGSKRMSSCSNSCTAFSATGFLFLFLMRPISKKNRRSSSVVSEVRPLPPSIPTTTGGPSSGTNSFVRHMMASHSVGPCSFGTKHVLV